MKYFVVVCCALLHLAQSRVFPDYLKKYICRKSSDPEYEKCLLEGWESMRRYFTTGFPELGVPPIDPFELPYASFNRTINDMMSISAVFKDIKVMGLKNTIIDDLRIDLDNLAEEVHVTVPWLYMEMDYDVRGPLMVIPLPTSGHFQGNITNIQMYMKANLKTYKKNGVDYFEVDKMNTKISIGDGEIKLTSNNIEMQNAADMITEFFNTNPRRVLDFVNPILSELARGSFREMIDKNLAVMPASDWLPA